MAIKLKNTSKWLQGLACTVGRIHKLQVRFLPRQHRLRSGGVEPLCHSSFALSYPELVLHLVLPILITGYHPRWLVVILKQHRKSQPWLRVMSSYQTLTVFSMSVLVTLFSDSYCTKLQTATYPYMFGTHLPVCIVSLNKTPSQGNTLMNKKQQGTLCTIETKLNARLLYLSCRLLRYETAVSTMHSVSLHTIFKHFAW